MFNDDFYPTPKTVISKMISGIANIAQKRILEASAGKGDILDYILEIKSYNKSVTRELMSCIEIEPELQFILKEKGYRVVAEDFLQYNTDYIFDVILMNPPFSNGVTHLLKAWDISSGAEIRCLLNAESINNPYTQERKLLANIIEQHGTVEQLGRCFKDAERTTNVDVVLITLKDKAYKSDFKFDGSKEASYTFSDLDQKDVATNDVFQNMESRYNMVKELTKEMLKIQAKIEYYADGLLSDELGSKKVSALLKETHSTNTTNYFNAFIEEFRKSCWITIMRKTKISELTTANVRKDFYKYQEDQGYMAFTKENMCKLFDQLYQSRGNIMQKCIEEAFDLMTKYYKENRCWVEGWITNDQWQVNRKIILPGCRDNWNDKARLNHQTKDTLIDIEKALCFITKKTFENINSCTKTFEQEIKTDENGKKIYLDNDFGTWYDSEFFRIKLFKKGTIHLEFNDTWLWQEFNLVACKYKNWLIKK